HSVRTHGANGGRAVPGAQARLGVAPDRDTAGHAGHSPATNEPVSQPDQEFIACGGDRLSRPGFGVCRYNAEPDRSGDRNHRHHHGRLSADFAGDQRGHELLRMADQSEPGTMSEVAVAFFVRKDMVAERSAPVRTTGFIGFLRTRLFNSPTNILLTLVGGLLIWFTVAPSLKFLLFDAVWQGSDRNACLAENAGHQVGACWPYIHAKFSQFIYGFYPEAERWRVNLTFILAALLLLPLLIPRLPAKGLSAGLFFIAFPVVAFFLLHGGGLSGFAVSWTAGLLSSFADSIASSGDALIRASASTPVVGPLLWLLGKLVVLLGSAVSLVAWPLVWLRDQIQTVGRPVWPDLALTAALVSALAF